MIAKATLGRLPNYLRYLRTLSHSVSEISATTMAKALGLGEVQVRKDLAMICGSGRPKKGYNTTELISSIESALGHDTGREAVIVGAGKLGMALLGYGGFSEYGLYIDRAFDTDASKFSEHVLPVTALADYVKEHNVEIGVLTVPSSAAQECAELMAECGIRAIWCFSASALTLPPEITVQYENLALSLAHLNNKITQTDKN